MAPCRSLKINTNWWRKMKEYRACLPYNYVISFLLSLPLFDPSVKLLYGLITQLMRILLPSNTMLPWLVFLNQKWSSSFSATTLVYWFWFYSVCNNRPLDVLSVKSKSFKGLLKGEMGGKSTMKQTGHVLHATDDEGH